MRLSARVVRIRLTPAGESILASLRAALLPHD
jgi:hypothetical protein